MSQCSLLFIVHIYIHFLLADTKVLKIEYIHVLLADTKVLKIEYMHILLADTKVLKIDCCDFMHPVDMYIP